MANGFRDINFYPVDFSAFEVTSTDSDGNALTTEFYCEPGKTTLAFTWTQEWNTSGVCTSWVITE